MKQLLQHNNPVLMQNSLLPAYGHHSNSKALALAAIELYLNIKTSSMYHHSAFYLNFVIRFGDQSFSCLQSLFLQ